ncbi:MAG: caspase family protein [Acidobacteriota bacterium]|nr:caspase family protein [Acidobacteriota bacterium]
MKAKNQGPRDLGVLCQCLLIVLALIGSSGTLEGEERGPSGAGGGKSRALIVAISDYAPGTGWRRTHADRDVTLMRSLLQAQGFDEILVLEGPDATREGIVHAVKSYLIEPSSEGDRVALHYSGHGQRIPDDNGDEPDGWDEAIVPWDAPARASEGYTGARHLRDDELSFLVDRLRRKLGERGHLTVFLDSCFSATPRGSEDERARGGPPLGPPAFVKIGNEEVESLIEDPPSRGQAYRSIAAHHRAPYAILSAARHSEQAFEVLDESDLFVGPLTWAVTRVLSRVPPSVDQGSGLEDIARQLRETAPTYRLLLEKVQKQLRGRVTNQPQLEGYRDSLVFGGGMVVPEPYLEIRRVEAGGQRLRASAGWVAGLGAGSRVAVHRSGTLHPTEESLLARGIVEKSSALHADVVLSEKVDIEDLREARVFVTRHAFGQFGIRVDLRAENAELGSWLKRELNGMVGGFRWVQRSPDLVVRVYWHRDCGCWQAEAETVPQGVSLPSVSVADRKLLVKELGRRLLDYARSRFLRRLDAESAAIAVDLEIDRVEPQGCTGSPRELDTCLSFPSFPVTDDRTWSPGDLFRLRARHLGRRPAFINVLALQPDGVIRLFWPPEETGDRTALQPGGTLNLVDIFQVTEPAGTEILLLLASEEWIDLRPFVSYAGDGPMKAPRGAHHELLGPLLGSPQFDRSASALTLSELHTDAVILRVVSGADESQGAR